ncbi:MAG: RagB/SusD family nutrient uptake outer membrane protein [Tannerella sp.]|nr:RagB/SusD family nutrient uptake outer membrane protein [Tannerella sp.]
MLSQYGAEEKHELLPIPQGEVSLNPNMTQNPGW